MSGAVTTYGLLFIAILAETFATSSLNASQQFTRLVPTLCSITGYVVSFYTFSHVVKVMPVDVEETARVFDLLLGDNLAGRKDYIAENGHKYMDMIDVS